MNKLWRGLAVSIGLLATALPVRAQTINEQQDKALYAGVYLNWAFGGDKAKQAPERVTYGFAASIRRGSLFDQGRALSLNELSGRQPLEIRFFDTNFNRNGFKTMSLVGVPLVARGPDGSLQVLGAADDGDDKKKSGMSTVGKIFMWTGVVAVGLTVYVIVASCSRSESTLLVDTCPVR